MGRKVKNYTDEFKKQIVALNKNGKTIVELAKEYELAKSTVRKWCIDYEKTGSFKAVDNRSEIENKLLRLEKENKQLKMEVDILKQAAVIIGKK